jgi:hypothetical protein
LTVVDVPKSVSLSSASTRAPLSAGALAPYSADGLLEKLKEDDTEASTQGSDESAIDAASRRVGKSFSAVEMRRTDSLQELTPEVAELVAKVENYERHIMRMKELKFSADLQGAKYKWLCLALEGACADALELACGSNEGGAMDVFQRANRLLDELPATWQSLQSVSEPPPPAAEAPRDVCCAAGIPSMLRLLKDAIHSRRGAATAETRR